VPKDSAVPYVLHWWRGFGKSHLISAVVQMTIRELREPGDSPDNIIVLLPLK